MKKTIIAAAALAAMVGCNKTLFESVPVADSNYGYINLGVSTDTEMVTTKALSTPSSEDLAGYTISLAGDQKSWSDKKYNTLTEDDWKVPAGSYTVTVINMTEAEAYPENSLGYMRVKGENTVTVNAGLPTECPVECKPVNSKISFLYTAAFDTVFDEYTVSLTNGTRTCQNVGMVLESASGTAPAAFFEPAVLTWTLSAKNAAGVLKTYTKTFEAKKGTWSYITFNAAKTDGSISVTITVNDEFTTDKTITEVIDPVAE